jgi:transcriptional regulator with XRE-family HTH domain
MAKRGRPRKPASEKLRQAIEDSSLSQHKIAKHVGVFPSAISRFRSGKADLRLKTAEALFELFDFEVSSPEDRRKRGRK